MKRNYMIAALSAVLMLAASCQKTAVNNVNGNGFLAFGDFSLDIDEEVITKSETADEGYTIFIYKRVAEELGDLVKTMKYSEVLSNDDKISLPAGDYTLVARSIAGDVPVKAWEKPVYGVSYPFSIAAGLVTTVDEQLECTLLQCKVTVAYSDDFLALVTGAGSTKVELTAGEPLEYTLSKSEDVVTYDQRAGYFAVNGNSMTVTFKGSVEGKTMSMTKTFNNIAPKQWRQIKFIPKKNEQGTATFDIVIDQLVSDDILNEDITAKAEDVIGDDPDAPKGDGGISMSFDYERGCDEELTDLENMLIVSDRDMKIYLNLSVPGGLKKFTVDITSDNPGFQGALEVVDAHDGIDLIYPTSKEYGIFEVVPFPYGTELLGQTLIPFDLSAAQDAIIGFKGTHRFVMNVMDNAGCKKAINVAMVVK